MYALGDPIGFSYFHNLQPSHRSWERGNPKTRARRSFTLPKRVPFERALLREQASSRISTRASSVYWRTRSRIWRALSFAAAFLPWPSPNKPCYLRSSRTSLKTSLPSGENRIFPPLSTGNCTRWAAAGWIRLPPVGGAHPA